MPTAVRVGMRMRRSVRPQPALDAAQRCQGCLTAYACVPHDDVMGVAAGGIAARGGMAAALGGHVFRAVCPAYVMLMPGAAAEPRRGAGL